MTDGREELKVAIAARDTAAENTAAPPKLPGEPVSSAAGGFGLPAADRSVGLERAAFARVEGLHQIDGFARHGISNLERSVLNNQP
jgi:hypothetical protein